MSDPLDALAEDMAQRVFEKLVPKFTAYLAELASAKPPNPLMGTAASARYLGISETKFRELVVAGYLPKAPGIKDIFVRQSELDAFGKKVAK